MHVLIYHRPLREHVAPPVRVYIILETLALAYTGWVYVQQQGFLARAVHTEGTVVDNWHTRRRGTDYYNAIFTFTDGGGKLQRGYDRDEHSQHHPAIAGTRCAVVYDPDDPARAEIEVPSLLVDVLAKTLPMWSLGGALLACGLWILVRDRLKRRPPPGGVPRDPVILAGP